MAHEDRSEWQKLVCVCPTGRSSLEAWTDTQILKAEWASAEQSGAIRSSTSKYENGSCCYTTVVFVWLSDTNITRVADSQLILHTVQNEYLWQEWAPYIDCFSLRITGLASGAAVKGTITTNKWEIVKKILERKSIRTRMGEFRIKCVLVGGAFEGTNKTNL